MTNRKKGCKKLVASLLLLGFLFENCTALNIKPVAVDKTSKHQENLKGDTEEWSKEEMQQERQGKAARSFDNIDLANLSSMQGFVIDGAAAQDESGSSVSQAGDINHDGIDDIIISAPFSDPNGKIDAGSSYVIYGKVGGYNATLDLSSFSVANGFRIDGTAAGVNSGWSVSQAGDINDDGIDDIIIGAPYSDPNRRTNAGSSYVIYGKVGGYNTALNLANLSITNGFRINGAAASDESGFSVSQAGDVNKDGVDDIIVGARGASPNNRNFAGSSYLIYGKVGGYNATLDLSSLSVTDGFRIDGAAASDQSGSAVSQAGDVNEDGVDDIIVGARGARNFAGFSYVIYGKVGGYNTALDLANLSVTDGFRIDGAAGDLSGFSVSQAGDVNEDGIDDIIVGARDASRNGRDNSGASYIIYGRAGGYNSTLDLVKLNITDGFGIYGAVNDLSGVSVSQAGDINGDGIDDLLIGAYGATSSPRFDAGAAYVVYGKAGGYNATVDLAQLSLTDGFRINGAGIYYYTGTSVSQAGDINGDKVDDIIIGAYRASPNGKINAGAGYVIYGINQPPVLVANSLIIQGREALTLNSTNMNATDVDNDNGKLIFKIHNLQNGQFINALNKSTLQFTQQEVRSGAIQFNSTSCDEAPSYDVSVSDVVHTTVPATAQISFTIVNCPDLSTTSGDMVFSSASSLMPSWLSPKSWYASLKSLWSQAATEKGIVTPEAKELVKLQAQCERMIQESDAKTADKWYRFSLEDLQEEIVAMLKQPEGVNEETVKQFRIRLEGINKDFLREPLLEKPSFFTGIQNQIEGSVLGINNENVLLQPVVMPMLGVGYVPTAIGK